MHTYTVIYNFFKTWSHWNYIEKKNSIEWTLTELIFTTYSTLYNENKKPMKISPPKKHSRNAKKIFLKSIYEELKMLYVVGNF